MDKRHLNQVHQLDRKSKRLLNSGKVDEAVACHEKAESLLSELISSVESARARESLEIQKEYHLKQQNFVRIQYRLSIARKIAKEREIVELETFKGQNLQDSSSDMDSQDSHELRSAILRTITDNDSLLAFLSPKPDVLEPKMTQSDTQVLKTRDAVVKGAIKTPANQQCIIEELELNNRELKKMVQKLYEEIETKDRDIQELNSTVKSLRLQIAELSGNRRQPMNDLFLPNGFSPLCELIPGGGIRELPNLAPLELPKFDYDSLEKTGGK